MGSGFRVWTAGEVVSASNVNNYLQEQTVMSFAGTAARSSAIASPEEGMLSYLQDSDVYQGYDGTNWVNLNTLSGTDTSGLVHINTTSFSAVASQSLNNVFTSTYDNYLVLFVATIATGDQDVFFRMRASGTDTAGTNYYWGGNSRVFNGTLGSLAGSGTSQFYATGLSTSGRRHTSIQIQNPFLAQNTNYNAIGASASAGFHIGGVLVDTTIYDGLTIYPAANTITGSISVYGYRKS